MSQSFQFKIEGTNIHPNTLRVSDLFAFLKSLEQGISATAESDGLGSEESQIFLTGIGDGSADCLLESPERGYAAAKRFTRAIASRDLSQLPKVARDCVFALQKKTRQMNCALFISSPNGMGDARLAPSTEFLTDALIMGQTTLSGTLLRVGGDNPTAQLRLFDNSKITVNVASQNLAIKLGNFLYKTVSVEGSASWIAGTWKLIDFKIDSIGPYSPATDIMGSLAALGDISGGYWNNIDPDDYISEMRAD